MEEKASWVGLAPMRASTESKESLEVWWFKLQGLSEEATSEPDAHCRRARHAPRAHQMGIACAPDLDGADEG